MYMKALECTHTILTCTLQQLHQIYERYVLLPEAQYWAKEGRVEKAMAANTAAAAERASAAVTAWILHSSLGWASVAADARA